MSKQNAFHGFIDNFKLYPPLNKYIDYRFKLFEFSCLASIRGQSNKNFIWVIIIDKSLDKDKREKLAVLIKDIGNAKVVELSTEMKVDTIGWLKPLTSKNIQYIITTNFDDDDILPRNFVEELHKHIDNEFAAGNLPPIKFIGFKSMIEWDFTKTKKSPLGFASNSTRFKIPSCGMSLICKYPDYPFSILLSRHNLIDKYLGFSNTTDNPEVNRVRNLFLESIRKQGESLSKWNNQNSFFNMSGVCKPVIITNHFLNASYRRLYEAKSDPIAVSGPDAFPGYSIDWNKAFDYIDDFKKRIIVFLIRKVKYLFATKVLRWEKK